MEPTELVLFIKSIHGNKEWTGQSIIRIGGKVAEKVNTVRGLTGQQKEDLACSSIQICVKEAFDTQIEATEDEGKKNEIQEKYKKLRFVLHDVLPAALDLAVKASRGKVQLQSIALVAGQTGGDIVQRLGSWLSWVPALFSRCASACPCVPCACPCASPACPCPCAPLVCCKKEATVCCKTDLTSEATVSQIGAGKDEFSGENPLVLKEISQHPTAEVVSILVASASASAHETESKE